MASQTIDVSGLMSSVNSDIAGINVAKSALNANNAAMQSSFADTAGRYQQIGDAAALNSTVQQGAQLQLEQTLQHTAIAMGIDSTDSMGTQADRAARLLASQKNRSDALDEVNAKKNTNFFDDPIGWIGAQLTMDESVQKFQAADSTATNAAKELQESNAALTEAYQTGVKLKTTVTAASIAANAEQAKNLALVQADEANRQALIHNASVIKDKVAMTGQQLQAYATGVDTKFKQQQIQISLDHLQLSRDEFAERVKEFNEREADRMKKEKGDTYITDTINRGLSVMGQPTLDVNSPKMLALISGKVPLDDMMKQAFTIGESNRTVDPSGKTVRVLGTSPTDTMRTMQYAVAGTIAPDQQAGLNMIYDVAKQWKGTTEYQQLVASKDQVGADKFLNEKIQQAFKISQQNMTGSDNPYTLPAANVIVSNQPGLTQLPFVSKILAPAMAAGVQLDTPSKVFNLGLSAVQKGDMSMNDFASDYATMYRSAQRINVASKQLANMGIAPTESYNTRVDTGGFISDVIDNAKAGDVLRAASKALVRTKLGADTATLSNLTGVARNIGPAIVDTAGKLGTIQGNSGFPSFEPTTK